MPVDLALAALLAAVFVAAFASGLAGFAFAMIASGPLFALMSPAQATALILPCSLFLQFFTIRSFLRAANWPRLWPFLAGGLAGIPLGAWILRAAPADPLKIGIGAFLAIYSAYMLTRAPPRPVRWGGRAADGGVGLVGGAMASIGGLSGALPTLWCGLRGWTPDEQRAVYQPFIATMQASAFAWLAATQGVSRQTGVTLLICLPALLAGVFLGMRLYRRADAAQFRRIVLALLFCSGATLVALTLLRR
jgi:hypothetical protein